MFFDEVEGYSMLPIPTGLDLGGGVEIQLGPPLRMLHNLIVTYVPDKPHIFPIDRLVVGTQAVFSDIKVVHAHGAWIREASGEFSWCFSDGSDVLTVVNRYNEQFPHSPVELIISCNGSYYERSMLSGGGEIQPQRLPSEFSVLAHTNLVNVAYFDGEDALMECAIAMPNYLVMGVKLQGDLINSEILASKRYGVVQE